MAVVPKLREEELENVGDIAHNLTSLQFESALTDEEKELLHLRKRSHAVTVSACAQTTYFASLFSEARQIQQQLLMPEHKKKTSRLLNETALQDPLMIGIIGCGNLGSHIVHCLLTFGEINPQEIKISTRRPETLTDLQEKGVTCVHNNREVAASVHLLFICVLPAQLPTIAEEIKDSLKSSTIVYSLTAALSVQRIQQLLSHNQVLQPLFRWDHIDNCKDASWENTKEVTAMFAERNSLEKTCPLSKNKKQCPIHTKEVLVPQMICAIANYLSHVGLNKLEVTNIITGVFLGLSSKDNKDVIFQPDDIYCTDEKKFPQFNLSQVEKQNYELMECITENPNIQADIIKKYCALFENYLEWKKQSLQITKKPAKVD